MRAIKLRVLTGWLIAAAVGFAAAFAWQHFSNPERVEAATQAPPPAERTRVEFAPNAPQLQFVKTEQVVLRSEPLLEPLSGKVAYDENYTARIASPVSGRVVKIDVQPGQSVKAGAALAWIDSPEYIAAVADVRKDESDIQQKRRAYARAKEMYEAEVLARKDFESAENDVRQAEAEVERARMRLRNLVPGGAATEGRFPLRSPIAGVVADRKINPGSEVRPDAPDPLFVITDPTHVWVIIDVPERYLSKVKVGQLVQIEVDAFRGLDIYGRIASIGTVLDPATRRVQVRCVVANPRQLLKPEMYARIVPLASEQNRLARIPNSALLNRGVYNYVFVETKPGVFEKRQIEVGLQGRDETYVKSGLSEGDRVVVAGTLLLDSELSSAQ
jgi:cobalt-zinc-cadmium efflux system membrane fusion protein